MRKKNAIININYDDKNQVVYIKKCNKKEEVVRLEDMTDKMYNKLQKQLEKSLRFCKFYTSNKIFIVMGLLLVAIIINFKFPTTIVSSLGLLSSGFLWRYGSICERIEKENSIELINVFSNSSFSDDYCYVNTKNNIDSLIVNNNKNKTEIKKESKSSVDSNIISIISDIRDMIISLDIDCKIFYCQKLNILIDEYKLLRVNFSLEEDKVRFLARLIILSEEVMGLLELECKKNKRLFRDKNIKS